MDTFLARQPIFDHRRRVFAYELLFRSGPENYFPAQSAPVPGAEIRYDVAYLVLSLSSLAAHAR